MATWSVTITLSVATYLIGLLTGAYWIRWRLARLERLNLKLSQDRIQKVKLLLGREGAAKYYKKSRRRKKFLSPAIYDEKKLKAEIDGLLNDIQCK